MAVKTFTTGEVLTAADTNTFLANSGLVALVPTSVAGTGVTLSNAKVSFSASSTVSVNGVFSTTYDAYRLVVTTSAGSTDALINLRLRVGGVDASGATDYGFSLLQSASSGAWLNLNFSAGTSSISLGYKVTANRSAFSADIYNPGAAAKTGFSTAGMYNVIPYVGGGQHNLTTAYDGFSLITAGGDMTGSLTVYGYRI